MNRNELLAQFQPAEVAGIPGLAAAVPRGDADLDPRLAPMGTLVPAAVLIPIIDRPSGLTVLFTRRTDHLPDHPGQVSFPGGRIEVQDADAVAAALRETEEEVGLVPGRIRVLGRLDEWVTGTGFAIVPVVGLVTPPFDLALAPDEVAEAFEVPLAFILDPANHEHHARLRDGRPRNFRAITYGKHFIWGATAGILINLCRRLRER